MIRFSSLISLVLLCGSAAVFAQGYQYGPFEVDANGYVKDRYIIAFQPRREGEVPVVWPPNPANHPPFPEHSSGQSFADVEAALQLNGDVLSILDAINMVIVRMSAREAERLRADPRVLYIEQDRMDFVAQGPTAVPAPLRVPEALSPPANPQLTFTGRYTLTLPSVDSEGIPGLYQNATIEYLPQTGVWRLFDYAKAVPVERIDEVRLILTSEVPVQALLEIEGQLTNGCLEVGEPGVKQVDGDFIVYLFYKPVASDCTGTDDLRPFRRVLPLPVYGLLSGTYDWTFNGSFGGSFTLTADNVLE